MKSIFSLSLVLIFSSCLRNQSEDYITIDGVKLPIDGCMEAQKRTTTGNLNSKVFCKCLMEKLYQEYKEDPATLKYLEKGLVDKIPNQNAERISTFYKDCFLQSESDSSVRFNFTPQMKETILYGMKNKLIEAGYDKTHDISKYCRCYINGLQQEFTMKEIFDSNFQENPKLKALLQKCDSLSINQ